MEAAAEVTCMVAWEDAVDTRTWCTHGQTGTATDPLSTFHAGFAGVMQDPTSGALAPVVGWHISHTPPKAPRERLVDVKAEIEAPMKGHKDETGKVDGSEPWCVRVATLQAEQKELETSLGMMSHFTTFF
jgi:hypothetical protein